MPTNPATNRWYFMDLRKYVEMDFHSLHSSLSYSNNVPTKGVVFFYFPGKDTFRMIFGKKEWVSEISGIFFFHSGGKKKYSIISHREKNTGLFFPKIVDFRQKKNSVIFLSYRPPYFCQNCEFQMKKPTSYLGQNWGSQTEIKKYRLIFVKTVYFWRK